MIEHIDYTVRMSRRARRARIVVRPDMSVEVVLPQGFSDHHAAGFVREKKGWIERSLRRFSDLDTSCTAAGYDPFPQSIRLDAVGMELPVTYQKTASDRIRVFELEEGLYLKGHTDDADQVRIALQGWLKQKAKELLPPMLEKLAVQFGYRYQKLTIRLQKSRWGSCSRAGSISLNAKLLLLPPHLCRYVMLHELAHLKYLNHSRRFWAEVERTDSDYQSHIRDMRNVAARVHGWADRQA